MKKFTPPLFVKSLFWAMLCISSASCGASGDKETDRNVTQTDSAEGGSHCNYLTEYAATIQGNYKAQKMAEMEDPVAETKAWVDYEDAQEGSPGKVFFDHIFEAIEADLSPEELQRQALIVCSKYTDDQLDQANFFIAVQ